MITSEPFSKYEGRRALARRDSPWLYCTARPIDIKSSRDLLIAQELGELLKEAIFLYDWIGASSNNLYWNGSETPVRVIVIPNPEHTGMITLINPTVSYPIHVPSSVFVSLEACGAFPGKSYEVLRKKEVFVQGYLLQDSTLSYVSLHYSLADQEKPGTQKSTPYVNMSIKSPAIVQHECDHLEGIVLSMRSLS